MFSVRQFLSHVTKFPGNFPLPWDFHLAWIFHFPGIFSFLARCFFFYSLFYLTKNLIYLFNLKEIYIIMTHSSWLKEDNNISSIYYTELHSQQTQWTFTSLVWKLYSSNKVNNISSIYFTELHSQQTQWTFTSLVGKYIPWTLLMIFHYYTALRFCHNHSK